MSSLYIQRSLDTEPLRDCYGHLLFYFTYRVVNCLMKSVLKMPRITKDYVGAYIAEKMYLCYAKVNWGDWMITIDYILTG